MTTKELNNKKLEMLDKIDEVINDAKNQYYELINDGWDDFSELLVDMQVKISKKVDEIEFND